MFEVLIQNINSKNVSLNAAETEILTSLFRYKKFRKNQYILQQGDISKYETLIIKGLARTYLVDDKGQEHVISFNSEQWWVGDLASHYNDLPANYNIDCLEETAVLQITKTDLEDLCTRVPQLNIFFKVLYRNSIISYHNRVASTLCKTALQRYEEFINQYPAIEKRVPNHQIASYLGIAPQSLSRLRKQVV